MKLQVFIINVPNIHVIQNTSLQMSRFVNGGIFLIGFYFTVHRFLIDGLYIKFLSSTTMCDDHLYQNGTLWPWRYHFHKGLCILCIPYSPKWPRNEGIRKLISTSILGFNIKYDFACLISSTLRRFWVNFITRHFESHQKLSSDTFFH